MDPKLIKPKLERNETKDYIVGNVKLSCKVQKAVRILHLS